MANTKVEASLEADENKWQIEDDARTIKEYYTLKGNRDRYDKAIAQLQKEDAAIKEGLSAASEHKSKIGLAKK